MADELISSAFHGNSADVGAALAASAATVNEVGSQEFPAIVAAAMNGHAQVVQQLIGAGADVNAASARGRGTALGMAAQNGHVAVIELLVENQADANAATHQPPTTALWLAAQNGYADLAVVLIDGGADVNAPGGNKGTTPLHIAVQHLHADVVRVLCGPGRARVADSTLQLALCRRADHPSVWEALEPGRRLLIAEVIDITLASEEAAQAALDATGWQLRHAVNLCLADPVEDHPAAPAPAPAPAPATAAAAAAAAAEGGGGTFATTRFKPAYDVAQPPRGPLELGTSRCPQLLSALTCAGHGKLNCLCPNGCRQDMI
jgi:ankyrin repeat protein